MCGSLGRLAPALDFAAAALLLRALDVGSAAARRDGSRSMPLLVVELGHRYKSSPAMRSPVLSKTCGETDELQIPGRSLTPPTCRNLYSAGYCNATRLAGF